MVIAECGTGDGVRRFDYGQVGWQLVARILDENNCRLSRTRADGTCNTTTSPSKRRLLLAGGRLRRRVAGNERRVARLIHGSRLDPPPAAGEAVSELLWRVADLTNAGLLPNGRLRTWLAASPARAAGCGARVAPEALPAALAEFAEAVHERWGELRGDPVPLAAWAEWQLNCGPLHPFYDGCGRIARAFGALLLVRAGWLLPLHASMAEYYAHGDRGPAVFTPYLRARIEACAAWIADLPDPALVDGAGGRGYRSGGGARGPEQGGG